MDSELKQKISVLWSGNLLAPFLVSGVAAMLPSMGESLGASAVALSLIMVFYNLGQTLAQLLGGRLGERYGIRRVLIWSLELFIVFLVCMAITPSIELAIGIRFGQGLAAGAVSCCVTAMSVLIAPPGMKSRVMGIVVTAVYLGLTVGPFVCGTITEFAGWRLLFWLLAVSALYLCLRIWRKLPPDEAASPDKEMDMASVMFMVLGISFLTCGATCGFIHPAIHLLVPIGLVFLALYVRREWTVAYPLLDLRKLSQVPGFATGLLAMFANYGAIMGLGLFFSLYLQQVLGFSAMYAGIILMVQSSVQVAVSPLAGRMADNTGAEKIVLVALVIYLGGLMSLFFLNENSSLAMVVCSQILLGLGCGLFAAPNMTATLANVPRPKMSVASGCMGCMRTFGGLMSQMTLSTIMGLYMGSSQVNSGTADIFLSSMRAVFAVYIAFNVVAIGVAALRFYKGKNIA